MIRQQLKPRFTLACFPIIVLTILGCSNTNNLTGTMQSGQSTSSSNVTKAEGIGTGEQPQPHQNVVILNKGFTQMPPDIIGNSYASYAAIIKNPNTADIAKNISVNVTLYNAAGTVVKSASESIAVIPPGQSAAVADSVQAEGASRIEVQALVRSWEHNSTSFGSFTAEGINTIQQQYGGMKTNATLGSTFSKDLEQVEAVAVYYNAQGAVMGGCYTYVDFVPAGGKVGIEISGMNSISDVARSEIYAYPSNMTLLSN